MKRYRVDFGYGRYFFDEREDGDWVRFEDHEARVRQELSLAEEGLANYAQEIARLRNDLTACQLERDGMKTALERYGHHTHPNCHDLTLNADGSFGPRNGCLCGFDAARSPTQPAGDE